MSKKTTTAIVVSVATILIGIVILVIFPVKDEKSAGENRDYLKEYLVQEENTTEDESLRIITIRDLKTAQSVINFYDGYMIDVPEDWIVPVTTELPNKLRIRFGLDRKSLETFREFQEIEEYTPGLMQISVFRNNKQLGLTEWLQGPKESELDFFKPGNTEVENVKLAGRSALRILGKETVEDTLDGEIVDVEIPDSSIINYVVGNGENIYVVSCVTMGEGFEKLASACERQVSNTFWFLPEDPLLEYTPFEGGKFEIESFGVDIQTGKPKYVVNINLTGGDNEGGLNEDAISAIVNEVNAWISSKGVNPKDLSIEWRLAE